MKKKFTSNRQTCERTMQDIGLLFVFGLLCILMSPSAFCQDPMYSIKTITHDDGGNLGYNRDVFQDTTGIVWVTGSNDGLLAFDGEQVKSFRKSKAQPSIPFKRVVQLAVLDNGNVLLSPQNDKFYEFNPYSRQVVDSTIAEPKYDVSAYDFDIDDNGTIWAAGFTTLSNNDYEIYRIERSGKTKVVDTLKSKTWPQLCCYQGLIYANAVNAVHSYRSDGSKSNVLPLKDNGLTVVPFRYAVDSENQLWLKSTALDHEDTDSPAIFKLNKQKNEFVKFDFPFPEALLSTEYINFIDDELWIGGYYENLWLYNMKTSRLTDFRQLIRKTHNGRFYILGVTDVSEDLRFVTTPFGLLQLTPQEQEKVVAIADVKSGICEDNCGIQSIVAVDSLIYFARSNKIVAQHIYTNELTELPVSPRSTNLAEGRPLYWDSGSQILSSAGGKLFHHDILIDPITYEHKHLINDNDKEDFRVVNGVIDSNRVWLLPYRPKDQDHQLFEYNIKKDKITPIELDVDLRAEQNPYQILSSATHDRVWLITNKGGLFEFNKKGKLLKNGFLETTPKISRNGYYCLYEKDDVLWIGAYGGLIEYVWQRDKANYYKNVIEAPSGKTISGTHAMVELNDSILILSGTLGLHVFDMQKKQFRIPSILLGQEAKSFFHSSVLHEKEKDKIYFGSRNGVVVFDRSSVFSKKRADILFPLLITEHTIQKKANKKLIFDKNERQVEKITLAGSDLWFSLRYVLPNYNADKVLYAHKLEGFDDVFSRPSLDNEVRYANLPKGNYTLKLRVLLDEASQQYFEKSIAIKVRQLWYKSIYFFIGCILLSIAIVYAFTRTRYNRKLQEQARMTKLRNKISRDLHDDVGSLLTGLTMQSEILKRASKSDDRNRLNKLNELSREAMARMRDAVWVMNASKDNWKSLIDRMNEFCQETLELKQIEYRIAMEGAEASEELPSTIRQNVFLIFKEAVANILKHSNATEVNVDLRKFNNFIVCSIEDNGSVVKKNYTTTGEGLSNMLKRVEQMNADMKIETSDGYSITLTIPIIVDSN